MGCPHGRGTTVFSNSSRFEGKFNNGELINLVVFVSSGSAVRFADYRSKVPWFESLT